MRISCLPELIMIQGGGGLAQLLPILIIGGAIAWAVVAIIKSRRTREPIGEGERVVDEATALMTRYRDAYLVARATATIGKVIKGIGILVVALGLGSAGQYLGGIGLLVALVGGLLYCAGVLVGAQGQVLLASLDTAVNSSPFLTNEDRARAMSL
ncbi:MAG: hypothetical protein AABO41_28025 [Acidobacteriota bacterium]